MKPWKGWAIVDKRGRYFKDPYVDYVVWISRTRDVAENEVASLDVSDEKDAPHRVVRVVVQPVGKRGTQE